MKASRGGQDAAQEEWCCCLWAKLKRTTLWTAFLLSHIFCNTGYGKGECAIWQQTTWKDRTEVKMVNDNISSTWKVNWPQCFKWGFKFLFIWLHILKVGIHCEQSWQYRLLPLENRDLISYSGNGLWTSVVTVVCVRGVPQMIFFWHCQKFHDHHLTTLHSVTVTMRNCYI